MYTEAAISRIGHDVAKLEALLPVYDYFGSNSAELTISTSEGPLTLAGPWCADQDDTVDIAV